MYMIKYMSIFIQKRYNQCFSIISKLFASSSSNPLCFDLQKCVILSFFSNNIRIDTIQNMSSHTSQIYITEINFYLWILSKSFKCM